MLMTTAAAISQKQVDAFNRDGYVIARGMVDANMRQRMLASIQDDVARRSEPIEYEADLDYPGAPASLDSEGGRTIRRLKNAISRDPVFTELVQLPALKCSLTKLLGPELVVPMAHHNCIMTKHPRFSSDTGWHQDARYWSFDRPELISVWVALGTEYKQNGGLSVIPGTHREIPSNDRLDDAFFLRCDLEENRRLIDSAENVDLEPGDVLFFHCLTFHSASRNHTDETKYSVVFTVRPGDNRPRPGTRSASMPELVLPADVLPEAFRPTNE
jgi:phytanoyl-CoA hydroxylase